MIAVGVCVSVVEWVLDRERERQFKDRNFVIKVQKLGKFEEAHNFIIFF
jgi:hypothetical protein